MGQQPYPSRLADRFIVRMPDGMRERIKAEARMNCRSANAQIVWMLQRQIEATEPTTGESLQAAPAAGPNDTALAGGPATHG